MRMLVAPASHDCCAPLHADIKHLASAPVLRALLTPHATTIAAFISGTALSVAVVTALSVAVVPVPTDVNATWTNLELLGLGRSYFAGTQCY